MKPQYLVKVDLDTFNYICQSGQFEDGEVLFVNNAIYVMNKNGKPHHRFRHEWNDELNIKDIKTIPFIATHKVIEEERTTSDSSFPIYGLLAFVVGCFSTVVASIIISMIIT
jgi:hypothetical protein